MTDVEQRAMMDAVIQAGSTRSISYRTTCRLHPLVVVHLSLKLVDLWSLILVVVTVDMGIVPLGGIVDGKTIRFGGS